MALDNQGNDVLGMIRALQAKRAALDSAINNLIAFSGVQVANGEGDAGSAFSPTSGNDYPTELPRGAFLNKSLPAAVKLYLSAMKKKQSIREIATALREGGVETTSPNFENVITGCLNRMKDRGEVLRFNDGWSLAEFYPAALRSNLAQNVAKAKTASKKARRTRKTAKSAKKSAPDAQSADGLEGRIQQYARQRIGQVVLAKDIVFAMPGTVPSVVSMTLGRLAKKFGWPKTVDGGYHIMEELQDMPKAVQGL